MPARPSSPALWMNAFRPAERYRMSGGVRLCIWPGPLPCVTIGGVGGAAQNPNETNMTPRVLTVLTLLIGSSISLAQIPADITLEPAFGGASFTEPVAVRHAGDGSGRKFIVQLDGRVRIVTSDGTILADPFLNVDNVTTTGGERGLLGLAFHPEYENNGLLYINHSADNLAAISDGDTVIAEYQVSVENPDQVDLSSRRQIMVIPQDYSNHNGGDIAFGPDGYLYIGMGDGGSGNDPCERGQGLDSSATPPSDAPFPGCKSGSAAWLLGKMLRIDIDNTTPTGSNNLCAANGDGSAPYAIPENNPFVGQSNRCGEVWAYGLRNPFRFSFDRENGDLWIGDVGQNTWEEISLLPAGSSAGANFGWKECEGSFERGSTSTACPLGSSVLPVLEYRNGSGGCSITGGYRYRGPVTSLQGLYIYSDYCSGRIFFGQEINEGSWTSNLFSSAGGFAGHYGFGEDEEGNVYLTFNTGEIEIFRGDTEPSDPVFSDRFED